MTSRIKRLFDKEKQIVRDSITLIIGSDDDFKRQPAFNTGLTALGILRGYSEAFFVSDNITFSEQYVEDRDRIALLFELYDAYYLPKVGDED